MRDIRGWIASGFGSGLVPFAPGTFGSAAALPLCWALGQFLPLWGYLAVMVFTFCLGCWAAEWVVQTYKVQDPGVIVIDEWVGMAITWLPVAYSSKKLNAAVYLVGAFLAFRLADIIKLWPANWADRELHGGFGTMLDDAFAALWSAALMALALQLGFFVSI
jgi:phosphatidylglycerophosphatase A